jgi:hypothetical protein
MSYVFKNLTKGNRISVITWYRVQHQKRVKIIDNHGPQPKKINIPATAIRAEVFMRI